MEGGREGVCARVRTSGENSESQKLGVLLKRECGEPVAAQWSLKRRLGVPRAAMSSR